MYSLNYYHPLLLYSMYRTNGSNRKIGGSERLSYFWDPSVDFFDLLTWRAPFSSFSSLIHLVVCLSVQPKEQLFSATCFNHIVFEPALCALLETDRSSDAHFLLWCSEPLVIIARLCKIMKWIWFCLHFTVPVLGKCLSLHMIFRKSPEYLNNFSLPLHQQ